jgi:trehalose 6-phosphate phosphatase
MRMAPLPGGQDALFLDFDGTLVELAERPWLVSVPTQLPALLDGVATALDGALAIVTGRNLAAVDRLLAPLRLRGAGLHGAELRHEPLQAAQCAAPSVSDLALRLAARLEGDAAVWVEDKGAALSLHHRGAPQRGPQLECLLRQAIGGLELEVLVGKDVVEARPRGSDKGSALRALMQRAPLAGRRPFYLGDDTTDEDGIAAAQQMGGIGIKVGPGPSAALARLEHPAAVRAWLARIAAAAR